MRSLKSHTARGVYGDDDSDEDDNDDEDGNGGFDLVFSVIGPDVAGGYQQAVERRRGEVAAGDGRVLRGTH